MLASRASAGAGVFGVRPWLLNPAKMAAGAPGGPPDGLKGVGRYGNSGNTFRKYAGSAAVFLPRVERASHAGRYCGGEETAVPPDQIRAAGRRGSSSFIAANRWPACCRPKQPRLEPDKAAPSSTGSASTRCRPTLGDRARKSRRLSLTRGQSWG